MKLILFFSWIIWPEGVVNHALMPEGSTNMETSAQDVSLRFLQGLARRSSFRVFRSEV